MNERKNNLIKQLKGVVSMANTIINGGASPYPKHVGPAAICSFSDGAQEAPLKSLKFYIEPSQSGSGDPSPSNIRPISGWSQVDGKQSGEDMTDYTPITIALGQTVYGGTVDALNGKMVIDRAEIDLGSLDYIYVSSNNFKFRSTTVPSGILSPVTNTDIPDAICSMYPAKSYSEIGDGALNSFTVIFATSFAAGQIWISDTKYSDAASFKAAVTGQKLVYKLATPIEIDLTPVSVNSLLGQNNIWCNTGDTELDYYPAAASVVAVLNRSSKVYASIPLGMIRYETYQITPQQTIDLDSYRSENGNLLRNPVATKCKLEFNTPLMTDTQWGEIWNIIKAGFNNNTERKLKLKYYDTLSATYKTGYFYVPDVQTTIRNIEEGPGVINYQEIRLAFIEY